jgi:hypothetical protein
MNEQNFSMVSGDNRSLAITIRDPAGALVDVSGASAIAWQLAASPHGVALVSKSLGDGISVVTSVVTVTLDAADTADLDDGLYHHELEIVHGGGTSTVLAGQVAIARDII